MKKEPPICFVSETMRGLVINNFERGALDEKGSGW